MNSYELVITVAAALALFTYGLQALSREIQTQGGPRLQSLLSRLTRSAIAGYGLGIAVTAIVQSSSAVASFSVALVDSGAITLRNSFAVLLGANVGTTVTAWLVSFKLSGVGAGCILAGMLLSAMPRRWSVAGRGIFYFGLILFSLDLVSAGIKPLKDDPTLQSVITLARSPITGVVIGVLITALVQSSSIVVGLAVVFAKDGVMDLAAVIPIVVGANLGSTTTALIASLGMGPNGRRAALANTIFNAIGVIAVLPVLGHMSAWLGAWLPEPGMAVAWAHLMFNLVVTALGFALLRPIERFVSARGGSNPSLS